MFRSMIGHVRQNLVAWLALFVALGGSTYATTGGAFVLGHGNTASSTSSLTAPVAGKSLQLTNPSTASGASALGLSVGSGVPPFTTNSATKVENLNADRLDGRDGTYFLPVFGKAADANRLDGVDSTDLIQGRGRIVSLDFDLPMGDQAPLLVLPDFATFETFCGGTTAVGEIEVGPPDGHDLHLVIDNGGANPGHVYFPNGGSLGFDVTPEADQLTFSLQSDDKVATVVVFAYTNHDPDANVDVCHYQGYAIVKGA